MSTQLSPLGRFERILLATDGSEYGAGAVRTAVALAARCGAVLDIMTTVLTNAEYEALAPERERKAEEDARTLLESLGTEADRAGVRWQPALRRGEDPYREIVGAAEDLRSDLIVMGRRGRRGLARMMVGDATAKVIGHASCSVLVAPRAADMWSQRILLATDGSRHADAGATAAGKLAQVCQLPLTVVSAVRESFSESRAREADAAVARVQELLQRDFGIAAEGVVARGQPDTIIVDTAAQRGADLIVMGTHGRTGLNRILLGSVTERVIGAAQCAVLAVKS